MKLTVCHHNLDIPAAAWLGGWISVRSCLVLLAACGWLLFLDIAIAAEPSDNALDSRLLPPRDELPASSVMGESVKAESDVLRLLIWEGHAPEAWIERFEKQVENRHGRSVKLKITYVTGGEEFYDAIRDRTVDVVMMTHHAYKDERFNYIQNRLLLPIDLANIPNFKHVIPAIRMAEYLLSERQVYAVPVSQGPYGLRKAGISSGIPNSRGSTFWGPTSIFTMSTLRRWPWAIRANRSAVMKH